MSPAAITFRALSKRYYLRRGWYRSLRDEVGNWLAWRRGAERDDVYWALRDVTFDVERGAAIGVIGANGAGKSTILKILSRVTAPTTGTFTTEGRVGALIEIGAGLHPDLTGRENVYLNGAVMGMRRREVAEKFDRIVRFAELERFIDTPIKYYSSGMQVRLGFSVAAHTDPDILLIDEVLAVGDAAFQRKCIAKLAELKAQNRTILLVSHNMADIIRHSERVLWLDAGRARAYGDPHAVADAYLRSLRDVGDDEPTETSPLRIEHVHLVDRDGRARATFLGGESAGVSIVYAVHGATEDPVFEVEFQGEDGRHLGSVTTRFDRFKVDTGQARGVVTLFLEPLLFVKGEYVINVYVRDRHLRRYLDCRARAAVLVVDRPGTESGELTGQVNYPHRWEESETA